MRGISFCIFLSKYGTVGTCTYRYVCTRYICVHKQIKYHLWDFLSICICHYTENSQFLSLVKTIKPNQPIFLFIQLKSSDSRLGITSCESVGKQTKKQNKCRRYKLSPVPCGASKIFHLPFGKYLHMQESPSGYKGDSQTQLLTQMLLHWGLVCWILLTVTFVLVMDSPCTGEILSPLRLEKHLLQRWSFF